MKNLLSFSSLLFVTIGFAAFLVGKTIQEQMLGVTFMCGSAIYFLLIQKTQTQQHAE